MATTVTPVFTIPLGTEISLPTPFEAFSTMVDEGSIVTLENLRYAAHVLASLQTALEAFAGTSGASSSSDIQPIRFHRRIPGYSSANSRRYRARGSQEWLTAQQVRLLAFTPVDRSSTHTTVAIADAIAPTTDTAADSNQSADEETNAGQVDQNVEH